MIDDLLRLVIRFNPVGWARKSKSRKSKFLFFENEWTCWIVKFQAIADQHVFSVRRLLEEWSWWSSFNTEMVKRRAARYFTRCLSGLSVSNEGEVGERLERELLYRQRVQLNTEQVNKLWIEELLFLSERVETFYYWRLVDSFYSLFRYVASFRSRWTCRSPERLRENQTTVCWLKLYHNYYSEDCTRNLFLHPPRRRFSEERSE